MAGWLAGTLMFPTQYFCSVDKHFWKMIYELAMNPVNCHGIQSTIYSWVNHSDTDYFVKIFNKDVQYLVHSLNLLRKLLTSIKQASLLTNPHYIFILIALFSQFLHIHPFMLCSRRFLHFYV